MSKRNEKLIFLSILAEQCGRYKDMVKYMEEIAKSKNEDLSLDERNLLFNAYKGRIWSNYQVLVKLKAKDIIFSKKGESHNLNYIREYKNAVDKDAEELCYRINNFIDENVIPKSKSDESKSFYYYNKAGYWKFLFEYGNENKLNEYSEKCLTDYYKALEFSKNLDFKNDVKLNIMYQLSYFLHEKIGKTEEGFKLAEEAYTKGKEALNNIAQEDIDTFSDAISTLNLIEENYYCWKV